MPFRRILLKVLFVSLAAAALLGAAGVLLSSTEGFWRIVWTCVATAAAALLMLATGFLAKREKTSALAAAALIIVEYLFTLSFVWDIWAWSIGERAGFTMAYVALCGMPAVALIHFKDHVVTRLAARAGLILTGIVFVLLMLAVWLFTRGKWEDRLGGIAGALAGLGTLAVLCLVGAGAHLDRHHWRWVGVAAAAIAFAAALYAIIFNIHGDSPLFISIVVLAAVIAHANVLFRVPLKGSQVYLRWITIGAGIATGVFIIAYAFADKYHRYDGHTELFQRLAGAAAILAGCGSLALLVLGRINRKMHTPPPQLAAIKEIAVTCPFCQKKQAVPLGDSRCATCGLLLQIELTEPRCPTCNYSLLMLNSERCPECGTPVTSTATVLIASPGASPGG